FQGDAALRESVVARLRDHIEAGRIVPTDREGPISDANGQRYSLMGGALNTSDLQAFESKSGIPAPVGRLQESVHGLLTAHAAWTLDWWQAVPPGADLQSLPSRFIAWLLQDHSAAIYPYPLSDDARATMKSLAQLHARAARGDAPSDEEWRTV